jgi:hypothetical protein
VNVSREPLSQLLEGFGLGCPSAQYLRPKPDGVLDRVKALEDDDSRCAPCVSNLCKLHSALAGHFAAGPG